MNYLSRQVVFREVPDEISLSYLITGCSLRCPGCHSSDSWSLKAGTTLTVDTFLSDIKKYKNWISCVLFMGGEWHPKELLNFLRLSREQGLKTALYTGLEVIEEPLLSHLDYLKTGPYQRELGGLDSPHSNQKLINVKTGEVLNGRFQQAKEAHNDSIK